MSKSVVLENSASFFNTLVNEYLHKTGVNVSDSVKNYLSELLQFYIFSDHLFSVDPSGRKQVKTLAELYLNSHYSNISLKSNLKKIGDTSLYISGFFRESLRKKWYQWITISIWGSRPMKVSLVFRRRAV